MEKTEAIVDTCFLEKLSAGGKKTDNIKAILEELDFKPVAHPYICEHELSVNYYSEELLKTGYIKKIEYSEFLKDALCIRARAPISPLYESTRSA